MMDCNTAQMLATFFGRGSSELAADDATALNAHLASCAACTAAIQQERAFDDRIGKAMLAVPVPEHLKSKLLDGLAVQSAAKVRHKAYGIVGIAAAVLLTTIGVIGWHIATASTLDMESVLNDADTKARNPQQYVDQLLADQGVSFNPEQRFDMNLLASVGSEDFQGKQVPTLKFVNARKNSWAKVFVIKATQFKWDHLLNNNIAAQSVEGFGHQAVIIRHADRSDRAYVVVFTGDLETFLENNSSLGR